MKYEKNKRRELYLIEILHQTTTKIGFLCPGRRLYLIEILHQTTTIGRPLLVFSLLYLIEILHQTTTSTPTPFSNLSCILSKFYIKPQRFNVAKDFRLVVSYRNSTSNHNRPLYAPVYTTVVSYRNSTSNHNSSSHTLQFYRVVSYRNSTSNHNFCRTGQYQ